MKKYQIRWGALMKLQRARHLSQVRAGDLYQALEDADRIIQAAKAYASARTKGDIAAVAEECGDTPERSSESWYEETVELENKLLDALEQLDHRDDALAEARER